MSYLILFINKKGRIFILKRKYFLLTLVLILVMFFVINAPSVNATMYKILDSEGNIIRITNNPVLSTKETEAGCKILSAPEGSIESIQNQIANKQETKQKVPSKNAKYDFRKTNWGMSMEQVKATEDKKPDSEYDTSLVYYVKIVGDDYLCGYSFLQDKLYNTGYVFVGKHTNENLYIDDYENLKEILTEKYGKPKSDRTTWHNDLYKSDRSEWGFAVSLGHLSYGAIWETPKTYITLVLNGDNYKINLLIAYNSVELDEWVDKIKEEKAKKDF